MQTETSHEAFKPFFYILIRLNIEVQMLHFKVFFLYFRFFFKTTVTKFSIILTFMERIASVDYSRTS